MKEHHHSRRWLSIAALVCNLIFYLGFVLVDGPVICTDSASYMSMDVSREPVYPLFLAALRNLFGTDYGAYDVEAYLVPAVILQAVIMAVCVWYTARAVAGILTPALYRTQHSDKDTSEQGASDADAAVTTAYAVAFILPNIILWSVDLLNRFAAARGSMYVECIMTESLCIPLYYVFVVKAYQWFRAHRRHDLAWLFALMLLMTSIRKQEMVTMVILCGFAFLYDLCVRRNIRAFVSAVAAAVIAFLLMTAADYGYNYALRGAWMHKTDNYKGTACTLLYTATADDAALFEDAEMRVLYEEIYRQMTEQGFTYDSIPAGSDWITRSEHYADAYDIIGYDILVPVLQAHVEARQPDLDRTHVWMAIDGYMQEIQDTLLGVELLGADRGRLVTTWLASYATGFVNTVLRKTPTLAAVAAILYVLYALGLLLLARQNRTARRAILTDAQAVTPADAPTVSPILLFACLVGFAIIVNVLVVGTMIFAQTRYMIYNMGFFYIALMGMTLTYARRSRIESRSTTSASYRVFPS